MRSVRRAMIVVIAAGSVGACSLVLDFDELLPLPVAPVDATVIDAVEEDAADAETICPSGFADCDGNGTCETNIAQDDPINCGACGRNCDGELCTSGVCAPQVIVREGTPQGIVADGDWVYWANNIPGPEAGIVRMASDAGMRTDLVIDVDRPFWLALDDAYLYFTTNAGATNWVKRVPKSGGAVEPLADGGRQFTNLSVANGSVFWTVRDDVRGLVNRVPITGGPIVTLDTNQQTPYGIATSGNDVYWVTQIDGRVNKLAQDGDGGSKDFLQSPQFVGTQQIAIDGQRVYWTNATNNANGGVYTAPLPFNKTFAKLAATNTACFGIALDGDFVYWATATSVQKIRKDGKGGIVTLATVSSGNAVRYLALDAKYVYFTAPTVGLVLRTPK